MMDKICFFQINRLGKFCVFILFHSPADHGTRVRFDLLLHIYRKGIPPDQRNPHKL